MSDITKQRASYSQTPIFSGDGYGYGGGAIVTIGPLSIPLGEGTMAHEIAKAIIVRWNKELSQ